MIENKGNFAGAVTFVVCTLIIYQPETQGRYLGKPLPESTTGHPQ